MISGFSCDYFDGYVARKLNLVSYTGNILDKCADKINHTFLLAVIINKYNENKYYLFLYFLRELIVFILRKTGIKPLTSSEHGKIKTFLFPLTIFYYHYNLQMKQTYLILWFIYNFFTIFI
jgi:phosphatidylglycerophosphate synthase